MTFKRALPGKSARGKFGTDRKTVEKRASLIKLGDF